MTDKYTFQILRGPDKKQLTLLKASVQTFKGGRVISHFGVGYKYDESQD